MNVDDAEFEVSSTFRSGQVADRRLGQPKIETLARPGAGDFRKAGTGKDGNARGFAIT